MNDILKLIKVALKSPEKKYYKQFNTMQILPPNKDWDWSHEEQKANLVIYIIEQLQEQKAKYRHAKKEIKSYISQVCWYDCFNAKARHIIKLYRADKRGLNI